MQPAAAPQLKLRIMKTLAIIMSFLLTANIVAHAQILGTLRGEQIIISTNGHDTNGGGDSVLMVGLEISSSSGSLVPFDPALADPFAFLLSNTPDSIVMASVPVPAVVADDQVRFGLRGDFDPSNYTASYGDANSHRVAFPICSRTCFPEPQSGVLATMAVLCLLGFARQRSR